MRLIDADEFVSMNREAVHAMFNKVVDEAHPTEKQMSKATMYLEAVESVLENLEYAPTIDAVPVVRCKDCKYHDPEDKKCDCGHAIQWQLPRNDDWFCADGERKGNDGQR